MRAAVSSELLDKLGSKITGFHQLSGLHWSWPELELARSARLTELPRSSTGGSPGALFFLLIGVISDLSWQGKSRNQVPLRASFECILRCKAESNDRKNEGFPSLSNTLPYSAWKTSSWVRATLSVWRIHQLLLSFLFGRMKGWKIKLWADENPNHKVKNSKIVNFISLIKFIIYYSLLYFIIIMKTQYRLVWDLTEKASRVQHFSVSSSITCKSLTFNKDIMSTSVEQIWLVETVRHPLLIIIRSTDRTYKWFPIGGTFCTSRSGQPWRRPQVTLPISVQFAMQWEHAI